MANLSQPITAQQTLSSSTTQYHQLGTLGMTPDGRKWRYCKAGAVDLVAGDMVQSPAEVDNHNTLTPTAAAIGATAVTVTLGNTAATANQYAGGYLITESSTAKGYTYLISGHPAADASATLVLTLASADGLIVALTSSSRVSLQANPYSGVIQCPVTTATGAAVGVAPYIIADGEYGWLGTGGVHGVLTAGTPAVGANVVPVSTTAGAVAIASSTIGTVGRMLATGIAQSIMPVMFNID